MPLSTRRPTGLPAWPCILLAGREGTGKSWAAATASGSEKIGRTLWVSIGETDPDMYGAVPGANFEIVEHDGTVKSIRKAVWEINQLPATDPPTLLVVDSMTKLWEQIKRDLQIVANRRAANKARRYNKPIPDEEVQITQDLWNDGKEEWNSIMAAILTHKGPSILTARYELVSVVDGNGQPTKEKVDKVQGEKNLGYEADVVIYMPERGKYIVNKVKSVFFQLERPIETDEWTVEGMWNKLGLEHVAQAHRSETHDAVQEAEQAQAEQPQARAQQQRPQQSAPVQGDVVDRNQGPQEGTEENPLPPEEPTEENMTKWRSQFSRYYAQGPEVFRDWCAWAALNGAPVKVVSTFGAAQQKLNQKASQLHAQRAQQERPQEDAHERARQSQHANDPAAEHEQQPEQSSPDYYARAAELQDEPPHPEH